MERSGRLWSVAEGDNTAGQRNSFLQRHVRALEPGEGAVASRKDGRVEENVEFVDETGAETRTDEPRTAEAEEVATLLRAANT